MNNSDFQRLLLTNDKALVTELNKPKKKGSRPPPSKGEGKGKGNDKGGAKGKSKSDDGAPAKGKGKAKGEPAKGQEPQGPGYRDRAKERQEGKGEYETAAAEWENKDEVSMDQSKYLGGDVDHTHLVKGLDFALLNKVRTEITKQKKIEEHQQAKTAQKQQQKKRSFQTVLARKVWQAAVENLHPHHRTFQERMQNMGKAISRGQRIRGAPSVFLPGRMCYEFDTAPTSNASSDIPRIIYLSKEEAPAVDTSKTVASALSGTVTRVRDSLQRAKEERKAKRDRMQGGGSEASHVVAQKVIAKPKAKDNDNDIFQGMGGFDTASVVSAKKPSKEEERSKDKDKARKSYFDDAGAEKYREAPEGQLDLHELEVEEKDDGGREVAFEACEKFKGKRSGWVFKLGEKGLGYYVDTRAKKAASSAGAASSTGERKPLRTARATPGTKRKAGAGGLGDDDGYGECFPEGGLGLARMATGDNDSDDEDDKKKKGKGKGKGDAAGDSIGANKKQGGDAKKRKMNEGQEWSKIDNMIKKGQTKSINELESIAQRPNRKQPPAARDVYATPAYF